RTIFKRTANTNSVRSQSNSSTYVPIFSTQQKSLDKFQTFQRRINSQQNDISNYRVEPPSRLYTPPKISYSACEQFSYSTPKPNSQQYFSMCIPQNFRSSTSYNHQLNQVSSTFSPLNISKSSFTHLSPQPPLFSSKNVRPHRAIQISRSGKQNAGMVGVGGISFQENNGYVGIKADLILNGTIVHTSDTSSTSSRKTSSGPPGRSLRASEFSGSSEELSQPSGPFGSSRLSEFSKPSRSLKVSGSGGIPETKIHQQSDPNTYSSSFSNQQPLEKHAFQVKNSQKRDEENYTIRPSIYTPLNINFSTSGQPLSIPYSAISNSQQSSIYVPQSFNGSTFYNPQSNQLSQQVLLPLNCSKSSPTCVTPQTLIFSLPGPKSSQSASKAGKQLVITKPTDEISDTENVNVVRFSADAFVNPNIQIATGSHALELLSQSSRPLQFSGLSSTSQFLGPSAPGSTLGSSGFTEFLRPSVSSKPLGLTGVSRPSESSGLLRPLEVPSVFPESSGFLGFSKPLNFSGLAGSVGLFESSGPSFPPLTVTRPLSPSTTQSKVGIGTVSNVPTAHANSRIPETNFFSSTDIGETQTDNDFNHPPHIHSINVECSKTMMTINIEFNRVFDGIIYSKGYYLNPECVYVKQNSGSARYSFTVNLDSCGTQFLNDFASPAGQAYLENVLVLQNEPSIQEVWDTVRRVRCLWEGNINKALRMNLSVDILNQEIIAFNGDTATTKLDIQIGRGPFAPTANGLVQIGETMTLVISVEGDPDFDLQVRDCSARDEASTNMLQLTDERGCTLKPKLFGAFQKTKDTANTGASIIAYAFFQAFKFPDVLGLIIECNVELCKTNCVPCPEANQQIEPGRRRRSLMYAPLSNNLTNSIPLSDAVRVGRRFKVIMVDDLNTATNQILDNVEETAVEAMAKAKGVCMNNNGFYTIFSLTLAILFIAILSAVVLYIKLQRIRKSKFIDS
ncbi:PREDICTED: cell wall protein RBR3-like, partial [Trachymyrmex cornetzi]|uniref:cell wall protein RBR3-like n=1 Tax=Trachymyrmex cornetzi TaxID=471704 RepID=UPI00084F62AA